MMQVFIIAGIILVAQSQQHSTQEAQSSHDTHKALDTQSAQSEQMEQNQEAHQVPPFPEQLGELELDFNNLYRSILSQEEEKGRKVGDSRVAGLITPVSNAAYESLIPIGSVDSLRNAKHHELSVRFALDSMSKEKLTLDDQRFLSSEGVKVQTYGGRELEIKKDPITGGFTVNGVTARNHQLKGEDAPVALELSDFLFNYRRCFTDALSGQKHESKATKPGGDTQAEEESAPRAALEARRRAEDPGLNSYNKRVIN